MKSILTQVFVSLGVIFLIVILFGLYFFVTDPFNIKPMLMGGTGGTPNAQTAKIDTTQTSNSTTGSEAGVPATTATGGFALSDAQKQALLNFGIDPAAVPSNISTEQEACFVAVLGAARVAEVKNGAVPSAFEFFKAKACI